VRLVADENLHGIVVARLRAAGHDVTWITEIEPGMVDEAVLEEARGTNALLLTEDKDFGELVFRQRLISRGVILLRWPGLSPEAKGDVLSQTIARHGAELEGAFTVIAPGTIRIRPQSR
jgi:predicted nuclease of predicted toxin-antitoxin system